MPSSVSKKIDVLRRNSLWQGNEDKKKYHLVKWEDLSVNKKAGGLSIRNMKKQNQSLMMKWLWKFATEEGMLWIEAILAKYGMEDYWITKNVTTPYGCSVSRAIRNLWPMMQIRTKVRIGNG